MSITKVNSSMIIQPLTVTTLSANFVITPLISATTVNIRNAGVTALTAASIQTTQLSTNRIYFPSSGGLIFNNTDIFGNLTVRGGLTALSGFNVITTTVTTTSALSVINEGIGTGFTVKQGPSTGSIAKFIDYNNRNVLSINNTVPDTQQDAVAVYNTGTGNTFTAYGSSGAASSAFVINSTGNVGIGITLPSAKLTVSGAVSASGGFIGAATDINNGAVTPSKLSQGGPSWDSDGNVRTSRALTLGRQDTFSGGALIEFTRATDNFTAYYADVLGTNDTNQAFRIVDNNVPAERIRIAASGNVGIGTGNADPAARLTVNGTVSAIQFTGAMLGSNITDRTVTPIKLSTGAPTWNTNGSFTISASGTAASPALNFLNQNLGVSAPGNNSLVCSTGGNEILRVDGTGNVGIRTSTPAASLHITGEGINTIANGGSIVLDTYNVVNPETGSTILGRAARGTQAFPTPILTDTVLVQMLGRGYTGTGFTTSSQGAIRVMAAESWNTTTAGTYITLETNPIGAVNSRTERVRIDSTGNVGIGTPEPSTKLDINGTLRVGGQNTSTTRAQGTHIEWNRVIGSGGTWILNQKGTGTGGFNFAEVSTNNVLTPRLSFDAANLTYTGSRFNFGKDGSNTFWFKTADNANEGASSGRPAWDNGVAYGITSNGTYPTSHVWVTSGATRMMVNEQGNVGINVEPLTLPNAGTKFQVGGAITLKAEDIPFALTDSYNTSGTYIYMPGVGTAGITDYALLRQIGDNGGGAGNYHLTLDLFDDPNSLVTGQQFSIRNVDFRGPSPDIISSRINIDGEGVITVGSTNEIIGGVAGRIRRAGTVKPDTWGGGVEHFDFYSDGGSFGAGPLGTKALSSIVSSVGKAVFMSSVSIGTNDSHSDLNIRSFNDPNYASVTLGANNSTGFHITKEASDNSLGVYTGVRGSGISRLQITSGGNIGINTAAPTNFGTDWRTLQITSLSGGVFRSTSTNGVATDMFSDGNSSRGIIRTGSNHWLAFATNSTERMVLDTSGNLGIGKSTDLSYKLHLGTDSAGKPSTNTWTIASDERVKENIRPYTKGIDILTAINPITYDYNGKAGFTKIKDNIGIIAQDIKDIIPEGISTYKAKLNEEDEEETELYNFNSHPLTYILINSVKELKEIIDQQAATIVDLQEQINELK